ncbi:MAG TPA: tetratricopeptide repeat protein [Streptosporangiaceae bacterium]
MFQAVFGAGQARDAYLRLRARPAEPRLVFRSSDPRLLALPWELMRDPDRPTPLAIDLAGVSRSLPAGQLADTVPVPGGRLRVLVVIARPDGEADVGYQMIARPLLQRLRAVRGQVDLVVLRPPTLDALETTLVQASEEGAPFHVVHFDGHGQTNDRWFLAPGLRDAFAGEPAEGVLVFEKPGGGADPVPASTVARVMTEARVPVVVLNACQSGAIGKDLEAAIATRLLRDGTASVVAMAYSVYAVAAAEFMAAFYERLFAGDAVSSAVTAGRKRMSIRNGRPSRKGDMPLDDWLIPVHYLRRDVSFRDAVTPRARPLSLDEELDKINEAAGGEGTGDLDPVGSFVGRDWLFCQLETVARVQRVVVLHGPGGSGKTELAKAFGRWWRDTAGVENPEWVFFHSFEPGVATFGLDGVVKEIGRRLFSTDKFDRLEPGQRRAAVEKTLTEHRMLLIWDNFETVHSMPESEPSGEGIKEFLNRLASHGKSAVLVTSRSPEDWLGDIRRLPVAGLTPPEADQYATVLLEPYPAARKRRRNPAFADLMEWLDGHPLSMRLILPHLETTTPAALLDALRGTTTMPGAAEEDGTRLTSLPASIAYSYTHLSEQTRRLLPAVSLFQGVADEEILVAFSLVSAVPERFRGATKQDWRKALDDADHVGLLGARGDGIYLIHPALPAYLADQWRAEEPAGHAASREASILALLLACTDFGYWLLGQIESGKTVFAFGAIGLHRHTFNSLLGWALAHEFWEAAQVILGSLTFYFDAGGLSEEADMWADRACRATEDAYGSPQDIESPAGSLWVTAATTLARRQSERFQLDQAEGTYQQVRGLFEKSDSPRNRLRLAAIYHELGSVAWRRSRLDEAENWCRNALSIEEELHERPGMATAYYQLGVITQSRGFPDEAENWYRNSVAIYEELGDLVGTARTYRQLGMIAHLQGRLDDGENWYRKALAIDIQVDDKAETAATFHQLGIVARDRGLLDDAEEWCRRALAIEEEIGSTPMMALTYQILGTVAAQRGRLDDAGGWYRKALILNEQIGDMAGIAQTCAQIGLLTRRLGHLVRALEWMIRCITVFDEFPHPLTGPVPQVLATLTRQVGFGALEENWLKITGKALPQVVREYVESGGTDD